MSVSRILAVKIGNTNLGIGIFQDNRLLHAWRAETVPERTADEYAAIFLEFFENAGIAPDSIEGAALVSVVPALSETLAGMCTKYFGVSPFLATAGIKSGIRIKYDDPRAFGADRLVSLVAAKQKYGAPLILIDLGTAATFNALDRRGDFIGGAIAPGLKMSANALHQSTATLPRIEIGPPSNALATNTHDALRSGIFFGFVGLVEGMVERLKREMGEPGAQVLATGGLADLLAPYCPVIERVDMDLALQGLQILYRMNR